MVFGSGIVKTTETQDVQRAVTSHEGGHEALNAVCKTPTGALQQNKVL